MHVYMIINDANGKYYVGKTVCPNLQLYFRRRLSAAEHYRLGPLYLHRAIRKYGADKFRIHDLMSTLNTNEEICRWERELIALFNAQDPTVGYNICDGGEGNVTLGFKGHHHSEASKRAISEARKGRGLHTEQWKAEARIRMTGNKNAANFAAKRKKGETR